MKKVFSLLAVFSFVFCLSLAYQFFVLDYERETLYPDSIIVTIPPKISAKAIGSLLEESGVIASRNLFYWSVRFRGLGNQLRSGEYLFPKKRSLKSSVEKLVRGDVLYHRLTIPEGLTSREIMSLLEKEDKLQGDLPNSIPEGLLLPETYTFFRGQTRQKLLFQMRSAMTQVLSELWGKYKDLTPLENKAEVLILASIVEKETAIEEERSHVAAVFLNRLEKGMPLQTDPTIIYAFELKEKKSFSRALTREDLKIQSPYNTYLFKGLPPSPICHPGRASLEAVLNPRESSDLFFVADGTGGHIFSKTYKEHAKNHNQWRKIKKEKKKSLF